MRKYEVATRAKQFNDKLKADMDKLVTTKGIESMVDAMKQGHAAEMKDKELQMKKQQQKPSSKE
jgi:hypothetical protein